MRRQMPQRRGITAVLAMLYLVLFATLSIGFFGAVTVSTAIASNEQRNQRALLAAESGMNFLRWHLATLGVPPRTPPSELFETVYDRLAYKLNNSPNMPSGASTIDLSEDETVISIPAGEDNYIALDEQGSGFRATITRLMSGEQIEVRVYGRFGNTTAGARGVKLNYANFPNPASIFNYGVASKSRISMNGNVTIRGTSGNDHMGSVLSAHVINPVALTMIGRPAISGNVSFVNPNATPSIDSSATIGGLHPGDPGFEDVIHKGVEEPEFPSVVTSEFAQFVPGPTAPAGPQVIATSNPAGTSFTNIRIKAGANPTFNNNTTIQGVVYIETPNQVRFGGNANIQGVIVVQTDDNNNDSLSVTDNTITFGGGVTFSGVNTLPATADFPATLRQMTGSMLLAPGFTTTFTGNFHTVNGSIIASKLDFSGTAGGTVYGSVINLKDTGVSLSGTSDIVIESQGTSNYPAGVRFGSHYQPLPNTYEELRS